MARHLKTIFQLRRATALDWLKVNPILRLAEPGFETDTFKLKIGDGRTAWADLPYVEGANSYAPTELSGIVNEQTHYDFPSVGDENYIYKAIAEHKIYQWDKNELRYVPISAFDEIELIFGGNASGNS